MPGNGHVRFGGRVEETDRWKRRHRASVRPYSWRVFAPREARGGNPAPAWWLWVFLGPDTACFVMDPTRSGAVLARHAGIDQATGNRRTARPGRGRRRGRGELVISSDFYSVYSSAGQQGRRPGQPLLLGPVCGTRDYAEPSLWGGGVPLAGVLFRAVGC